MKTAGNRRSYTGVDTPEPTGKGARDSRMVSGRCQVQEKPSLKPIGVVVHSWVLFSKVRE